MVVETRVRKSRARRFAGASVVALSISIIGVDAHAGQDRARVRFDSTADVPHRVDLQMSYAYPPAGADIDEMEALIQGANRIICDATDGQLGLGKVWLTSGAGGAATADVYILPPGLWDRSSSSGFILHDSTRIFLTPSGRDMTTLAHELSHAIFRLRDEYGEQSRYGSYHGFGFAIEPGLCTYSKLLCWTNADCGSAETCDGSETTDQVNTLMGAQIQGLICAVAGTPCASDLDCPAPDVCLPHPFYSEFSTNQSFDLVAGDGEACPEDRPGTVIVPEGFLGANLDSEVEDAALPFDGTTWETAKATASAWEMVRFIDEVGVVAGYEKESSHEIGLFFKHIERSTREWELHVLIDNKHLADAEDDDDGTPLEIGMQLFDFNGGATTYLPAGVSAWSAQGTLVPIVVPELEQTTATWELELDLGELVLRDSTSGVSLARSGINADGVAQRGNCDASAAAEAGGPSAEWCAICEDVYNTNTDRWETSTMTIEGWLGEDEITLGDSEWDQISKIDERYPAGDLADDDPDAFHGGLTPPATLPTASPPASCWDPVEVVTKVAGTDAIVLAIDVSGSMENDLTQQGETATRLEWAQGAARALAELTALHNDSAASTDLQMFGIVAFATSSAPISDELEVVNSANLSSVVEQIDDLSAGGDTALADGIAEAGDFIEDANSVPRNPAVVVMTDGEANVCFGEAEHCSDSLTCTCGSNPSSQAVNQVANLDDEAAVYFVPLGAENGAGVFADAIQQTSGEVFPAPQPADLAIQYARAYLRISGLSAIVDGATWEAVPQTPPVVYEIPVETDAGGVTLLLTARNATVEDWDPTWSLESPSEVVYSNVAPGVVDVYDDPSGTYYRILRIDAPEPGTWTLGLGAALVEQHGALTAWTDSRAPGCFVSAARSVVEETTNDLEITVSSTYVGPVNEVDYTVHVIRPDGSAPVEVAMQADTDEGGTAHGVFPAEEFHGRGTYVIFAECDASDAWLHPGESLDPDAAPLPATRSPVFQRVAASSFFLDVSGRGWIPDGGDCDGNGISDTCEGASCMSGSAWCDGDAVPCSSYSAATCNTEHGCSWSASANQCVGTRSCSPSLAQAACVAIDGCEWNTHPCPPSSSSPDSNGNGILDACDPDNDGDDVPDRDESPWCGTPNQSCQKAVCGGLVVGCCPGLHCGTGGKCIR
jgi:hypothetical protein